MYDIAPSHFKSRRDRLMDAIGTNSVAVLFGAPERTRSNDTEYPYRPSSDILYLSGFREPECVAIFAPGHDDGEFVLFVRARDPEKEVWDGRRFGVDGVIEHFQADQAYSIGELETTLPKYLEGRETLFFPWGTDERSERMLFRILEKLRSTRKQAPKAPKRLADLRDVLHDHRVHKRPEEIEVMREAAQITAAAHVRAMRAARPGVREYEIQAEIECHFRSHGADFPAYTSIVGAGVNATILHYTENRSTLEDGDVVLIDAGCEFQFYAADITRSFPVSGKFSPAQRDAYQAVLDAQKAAIEEIKPGLPYDQLQIRTVRRLTQSLVEMGVLSGDVDVLVANEAHKRFYPHNVGHFLGIDVHDVGNYFGEDHAWRPLEPGMVLTIEPGLYFPDDDDIPAELRGVGIRIEDDILVTEDGYENLTAMCPKEIEEIEAIVGQGN